MAQEKKYHAEILELKSAAYTASEDSAASYKELKRQYDVMERSKASVDNHVTTLQSQIDVCIICDDVIVSSYNVT